jgi:hypothetical protein
MLLQWSTSVSHGLILIKYLPLVEIRVEERTLICAMTLLLLARLRLIIERMVLMLFPAMAFQAPSLKVASLLI